MTYSKRWELVHLLGGKCKDCNNENFYELEIDHIYDDGDGERKFYTSSDKRYLNNPIRANQRLQVLCKKCHEKKHHPILDVKWNLAFDKKRKLNIFMGIINELEGVNREPVSELFLIYTLTKDECFTDESAKNYVRRMLREASIYESKPGCYNSV